jgi:cytosine/adenosine deaminase-related metal-dependent hydrolase
LKLLGSPPTKPRGSKIIEWLARRGIDLAIEHGALIVRTDLGRIAPSQREAIEAIRPLLVGWLTGRPVACYADPDAAAVTMLLGGTPACAEHAGQ